MASNLLFEYYGESSRTALVAKVLSVLVTELSVRVMKPPLVLC